MPRDTFQQSLDDLRADVRDLGDLVLDRLDDALEALRTGDGALARSVVDGDDDVNERYLALEAECVDLLALQQPVAGDLRFVVASFKVVTDLERVGDLAANLAEYALAADDRGAFEVDVQGIGDAARDLLADALDAYEAGDADACHEIAARDDEVDARCRTAGDRLVRDLVAHEAGSDAWTVEALLDDVSRLLLTIRDLERVADHAVNVAARTLYAADSDPELVY
ncbi:phosphate signaling complex protein PhoU [Halobacterium yunchengense]|uniref:phosphate signaling complex protein PhoU n=1 Tax=Halobacterium yunchengense TaxID=3108497 RepID=UPI00300AD530